MTRLFGRMVKGIARGTDLFFGFLIALIETLVNVAKSLGGAILSLIGMFGCMFFIFFPVILSEHPGILIAIIVLIIFPILGATSISFLKYTKYSLVEFLNDYGDYLIIEDKESFRSFSDYAEKYNRMQDEKARREREERQKQQQRMWDERFNQWFGNGNFYGGYWTTGESSSYDQGGYQSQQGKYYQNPLNDFNRRYKEACQTLGVSESADKYEIKLAFRKLAKQYHPDINKEPGAKEMFQKVNNAYEFLSDENIERYKKMNQKN